MAAQADRGECHPVGLVGQARDYLGAVGDERQHPAEWGMGRRVCVCVCVLQ
jgi:hypothetical protein